MWRKLKVVMSVLSLILCIGFLFLWMRSNSIGDELSYQTPAILVECASKYGRVSVVVLRFDDYVDLRSEATVGWFYSKKPLQNDVNVSRTWIRFRVDSVGGWVLIIPFSLPVLISAIPLGLWLVRALVFRSDLAYAVVCLAAVLAFAVFCYYFVDPLGIGYLLGGKKRGQVHLFAVGLLSRPAARAQR